MRNKRRLNIIQDGEQIAAASDDELNTEKLAIIKHLQ